MWVLLIFKRGHTHKWRQILNELPGPVRGPCTQQPSLDTEIDDILVQHGGQLAQYRHVHSRGQLLSWHTKPCGVTQVFRNTCKTTPSPLLRLGQGDCFKSVCGLLTRWLLLQNAFTRPPVASQESSWLKGELTEGRVRCQSACGNVSRSICWLVPTGQKANICFAETKHFHLKTFAVETILWYEASFHSSGWNWGRLSPVLLPLWGWLHAPVLLTDARILQPC